MCRLLLMTIACLLILFGISGLVFMPKLIQQKIEQRLQLRIGTKSFDRFTKVPIPLTVKFYLFNVTNSERVLAGLERPKFREVGPFMYKQWRRREIVDFEDYNRRLRYREYKTFYPMFSQQQQQQQATKKPSPGELISDNNSSSGYINQTIRAHNSTHDTNRAEAAPVVGETLLDPSSVNVTIINLPLLAALTKVAQLKPGGLKRNVASKVMSRLIAEGKDKILVTQSANELLFNGYKVNFMESARNLFSETFSFNFESPLPANRFGFFYNKNNTWTKRNGELTVFTGRNESMKDFMVIDNWNDQRQLRVWPKNTIAGNRCNEIRGTDGSQFHPGATRDQVLSIFSPMICTSIRVVYKEDTSTRGIPLLRFSTPPDIFAAPKKNARNACYCTVQSSPSDSSQSASAASLGPQINDSRCYLDGLLDLSLCEAGAPVAASSPHFYNADPMLAMAAGLQPQKEIHETYLDIEPMTGSVFRAASRAQVNAYVEQAALDVVDSSIVGNMTAMVAPLFWLEELGEIDEKSSIEFKSQLLNLVQKARRSFYYSIVAGCLLAIIVCVQYWYVNCYKIDREGKKYTKGTNTSDKKRKRQAGLASRSRRPRSSSSGGRQAAANLVIGAAALGAASSKRKPSRQKTLDDDHLADEQLSKRRLMVDEWEVGEASTSGSHTSGRSSSSNQRPQLNQDASEREEAEAATRATRGDQSHQGRLGRR